MVKIQCFQNFSGSFRGILKTSTGHWKNIRVSNRSEFRQIEFGEGTSIMKPQTWKRIGAVGTLTAMALTAVLILVSVPTAGAQAGRASGATLTFGSKGLTGSWQVTVQLYDCATEAPLGLPFASMLTFNLGGTMAGSTTNPGFAVGQRGPDQGNWSRVGHNTYTAKSTAFIYFTTPAVPPFNPGFNAGTQTLTQTIEFKRGSDEFSSDATTEFFDVAGLSYRQGCASAVGERLK
jgi:hypothetical protein